MAVDTLLVKVARVIDTVSKSDTGVTSSMVNHIDTGDASDTGDINVISDNGNIL